MPLDRIFVDFSRRKLAQLTGRIESALDRLTDEQVWLRGHENANSAGNLILHLAGNVRQWIVSGVGGAADTRQRDLEFATKGGAGKAELIARLRETIEEADAVLASLPAARLEEMVRIQGYDVPVMEAVFHVVEHFSQHTGQILFATKLLTPSDLGFYAHLNRPAHQEATP